MSGPARISWPIAVGLVLASIGAGLPRSASAAGGSPRKQCFKTCKVDRAPCLKLASARKDALVAECAGEGAVRRRCLGAAKHVFKVGRQACGKLLGDCRACCKADGVGPTCPVGHPVEYAPPPPLDLAASGLPMAASGRPLMLAIPGAHLEIDSGRRDALTALGGCARWITACVVSAHVLDDCARSVPLCATDRPWEEPDECCAASCFERYQAARRAGTEALDAFDGVFYGADPCMPGVRDLLQAGRP